MLSLDEAIAHADYLARPKLFGKVVLIFYVCKWNDGYIVFDHTHVKRYDIKYVYSTDSINKNK